MPVCDDKTIARAAEIIGVPLFIAEDQHRPVDECPGAWYFWGSERGSLAVIINGDGEYLAATSAVNYDEHVREFLSGRRS